MVNGLNNSTNFPISAPVINQEELQNTISKSKQVVTDNFESNSVVKVASGNTDDPQVLQKTLFLLPPMVLLDRFIEKLIGGSEKNSLLTKAANVGDKISNALKLDSIISPSKGQKLSNAINKNRFTKYFTNEFKAIPKFSIAKGQTLSQKFSQEIVSNLTNIKYDPKYQHLFEKGATLLSPETAKVFESVGPLKSSINADYLKSVTNALRELASKAVTVEDRNAAAELLVKISDFNKSATGGASTLGLADDIASVLSRFKDTSKYGVLGYPSANPASAETIKVLSSVSKKAETVIEPSKLCGALDDLIANGIDKIKDAGKPGDKIGWTKLTSDPIRLSTLNNKLKAAEYKLGKTGLGKLASKGAIKTKDILTYGGGILSLAFAANGLIQSIKAAKEAPEGEKKSTFMHVLSEQYLSMIILQPITNFVYKAGGNKYRGMTKEGVEAYRKLVTQTNLDETLTKEGLKVAKLKGKLLLKGVDSAKVATLNGKGFKEAKVIAKSLKKEGTKLKFWEKPLKTAGKILGTGLETIRKNKNIKLPNGKKIKLPTLKGFAGGLGRFLLILMVLQPIVQKPITKLCHKLFGEPKAYLAKQNAEAATGGADSNPPEAKQNPLNSQNTDSNLIRRISNSTPAQQPAAASNLNTNAVAPQPSESQSKNVFSTITDMHNMTPSDATPALGLFNRNKNKNVEKSSRYIPSIVVEDLSSEREKEIEAKVNEILSQSNGVIAKAQKKYG